MSVRNLDKLLKPRAVALIGATPRPQLTRGPARPQPEARRLRGPLMLINPHQRSIGGMPVYSDIASYSGIASQREVPDLAVIATQPETVPGAIAGLGAQGTRAPPQQAIGGWEPIRRN
jgi:acetyltransferase